MWVRINGLGESSCSVMMIGNCEERLNSEKFGRRSLLRFSGRQRRLEESHLWCPLLETTSHYNIASVFIQLCSTRERQLHLCHSCGECNISSPSSPSSPSTSRASSTCAQTYTHTRTHFLLPISCAERCYATSNTHLSNPRRALQCRALCLHPLPSAARVPTQQFPYI